MKIQKNLAYKYKQKNHYKHVVIIPNNLMDQLGWSPDSELEPKVEGNNLILKAKLKSDVK